MRKPLLIALGLVLVFVVASVNYIFDQRGPWSNRWCSRELHDEAQAPSGKLVAKAVLFGCGIVAPGSWTAVAIVAQGRTPTEEDEVLIGDFPNDAIALRWPAVDRLEIYMTKYGTVSTYKPQHAGITIDLITGRQP